MNEKQSHLTVTINGKKLSLKEENPTITLLEYLKQTGKVGTKEGCGDGDCGACTVVVISPTEDGKPEYLAVNSCLIPLGTLLGKEVITVEGITREQLHPVQQAMVNTGGSQCGYCTPGFIMSMFAAYYKKQVDDLAVEGNLCRCTGYLAIRRAAKQLSLPKEPDYFQQKLDTFSGELEALSYEAKGYKFYIPINISQVIELLQKHPEAVLVAGATELGLDLSHHRRDFPVMISLEAVKELKNITETKEYIEIGAAVTLSHVEKVLHGRFPSLDKMLHYFAARQVRNRATMGGNIASGSPIGDLPPVLLSLDAELLILGKDGTRTLPLAEFFKGYRQTDLQPSELITTIKIPKTLTPTATRRLNQSYKIGKRGTDDISIVAAAFTIDLDSHNRILHARLAYGGVAASPARAIAVETMLINQPWEMTTVEKAKEALKVAFTPLTDFRGSAEYRTMLVANLFQKFFVEVN